jgi:hypothetical protein
MQQKVVAKDDLSIEVRKTGDEIRVLQVADQIDTHGWLLVDMHNLESALLEGLEDRRLDIRLSLGSSFFRMHLAPPVWRQPAVVLQKAGRVKRSGRII